MSNAPLFMTHHAPVAAWSSLTFGLPGHGVSIDHEDYEVKDTADFLIALSHGPGKTIVFPFIATGTTTDYEGAQARVAGQTSGSYRDRWAQLAAADIRRTFTPSLDEFASDRMTIKVYTPHASIPNPKRSGYPQFSIVPGLLLDVTFDNTHSDESATGFVGLGYRGPGRIRPMDWSTIGRLAGVAFASNWALAATAAKEPAVSTLRDNHIAEHVEAGMPLVHNGGNEGGILVKVPARQAVTIPVAFAFYHGGAATQGIEGGYYYTRYFTDLETVCDFVLRNAQKIRESCVNFDRRCQQLCPEPHKLAVLAQGLRAYHANSQLILSNGIPYYSVSEGQFNWRNTLDVAVDHLPWELYRHPWVVRNVFDLYSAHYSYRDELTFPSDPDPAKLQPGGLSYAHDVGSYTCYCPAGTSAYEQPGRTGMYSYATTEELLDAIYLLTSYALMSDDEPWSRTRLATARELLDSMQARDHYDPAQRTGILKAESSITGPRGAEITTYDSLDASLRAGYGSLYLAIKTWCANLLLTAYFQQHHDQATAQRAYAMAHQTANALAAAFDAATGCFPANLFAFTDAKVIAALEPMAIPAYCNIKNYFAEFPDLMAKLKQHALTCLKPGVCIDAESGGLRLTSTSENTWPSKLVLTIYTLEEVLGIPMADYPAILEQLAKWTTESAGATTLADQIDARTGAVKGGTYYPRAVSAAIWIKQPLVPLPPTTA